MFVFFQVFNSKIEDFKQQLSCRPGNRGNETFWPRQNKTVRRTIRFTETMSYQFLGAIFVDRDPYVRNLHAFKLNPSPNGPEGAPNRITGS